MSDLRRVTSNDIPEEHRWSIYAAWDVTYNLIRKYIDERANHFVGGRFAQPPAERAIGAKADGKDIHKEINGTYGVMPVAIDADIVGKAARGELAHLAPSPAATRLLGIGTVITMLIEVSIFLVMWLLGQGGNLITVGVGVLLAMFGYGAGEGLGRLLIAKEDTSQRAGIMAWIFLFAGSIGIGGLTLLRYLAARAAAEEGEEVTGLIALVIVTALVALAVAVFHAAHMERAERYRRLVAQMFLAQALVSQQHALANYSSGLWTTLYDQAVDSLVSGRPNVGDPTKVPIQPNLLFPAPPPEPAPMPAPTPMPVVEPKSSPS